MNANGKDLFQSVVTYEWTDWEFLHYLFLMYLIGSVTIQNYHSLWTQWVRNGWLVFIFYSLCLFEFLIGIKVSFLSKCLFFIFEQCSWLNSGWAVVATSSIHELALQSQNINDSRGILKEHRSLQKFLKVTQIDLESRNRPLSVALEKELWITSSFFELQRNDLSDVFKVSH